MKRLHSNDCALLVIDVQEKLMSAMPETRTRDVIRAASVLLEASKILGIRAFITEQYPQGLGPTVEPLREKRAATKAEIFPKMDFSACDDRHFDAAFSEAKKNTVIVLGVETHVCVFQTVRELCSRGMHVYVVTDGVASRRDDHREVGIQLCERAGAISTNMESVVFDWLRSAGTDAFKQLSKLIR